MKSYKKVLLLGSGGLSIGQAGEFDYSGTQAIKAFREAGIHVVLINPNIATVQTNPMDGVTVYLYPVNVEWVERVIEKERPEAIAAGFGGQTALNCLLQLHERGILEKHQVTILGTPIIGLRIAEDRKLFAEHLEKIGLPVLPSRSVSSVEDALIAGNEIGFPLILRAAYALGGLGSGIARDQSELKTLAQNALSHSPQVILEKSLWGWKELEYEVMRDSAGNSIAICNMENIDPLGIHTGDSIVVAPSLTLSDEDYQLLRNVAIEIANTVGVIGECNVQFALSPLSSEFYIIETNPRLSRSSALASKATGYPIAYIAAKVILGQRLVDIRNPVNGITCALFEPAMDYVAIKVPRWDLIKFTGVSRQLGSAMKSVGEVMAIGRGFTEAFQKAIRMVYENALGITRQRIEDADLEVELATPTDTRIFAVIDAFRQGKSVEDVYRLTFIDQWFLHKFRDLVTAEKNIRAKSDLNSISRDEWLQWKKLGFSDLQIAAYLKGFNADNSVASNPSSKEIQNFALSVRTVRISAGVVPYVKKIDTTAAEYPATSNYLYLSYYGDCHDERAEDAKSKSALVIGCGPYRIGTSVEFDWCAVASCEEMKRLDWRRIVVNCNPETVSTDFNSSDRLYFEEISVERLLDIHEIEGCDGVIGCMGGQAPNNLAFKLASAGVKIFGHSADTIELAENREKFSDILDRIGIGQPRWCSADSREALDEFINKVGYPVLVRPSFVLSGAAMRVAYNELDLERFLNAAVEVSPESPAVVSEFILGALEVEIDGVAKSGKLIESFISEHVEHAGVHSGDATIVFPAQGLSPETQKRITAVAEMISQELNLNGPFNIQLLVSGDSLKVIECNARASRSFPFVSKVSGKNLAALATDVILEGRPAVQSNSEKLKSRIGVKASVFSFARLKGADPILGVEMVSTGEVACIGKTLDEALALSFEAAHLNRPRKGLFVSSGTGQEKQKFLEMIPILKELKVPVYATPGSHSHLIRHSYHCQSVSWFGVAQEGGMDALTLIRQGKVDLVINIPKSFLPEEMEMGKQIRLAAIQSGCMLLTDMEKTIAFLRSTVNWSHANQVPHAI